MERTTLLLLAEVMRRTTLGKTRIYQLVGEGSFPSPARLGARRVAWDEREVEAWIAQRLAEREMPSGSGSGVFCERHDSTPPQPRARESFAHDEQQAPPENRRARSSGRLAEEVRTR